MSQPSWRSTHSNKDEYSIHPRVRHTTGGQCKCDECNLSPVARQKLASQLRAATKRIGQLEAAFAELTANTRPEPSSSRTPNSKNNNNKNPQVGGSGDMTKPFTKQFYGCGGQDHQPDLALPNPRDMEELEFAKSEAARKKQSETLQAASGGPRGYGQHQQQHSPRRTSRRVEHYYQW